jgi:hypothetical protein
MLTESNICGADKLHQQYQKINSKHCRVSESDWNYCLPLMVYLIANIQNLKICTATLFEKRARKPTLDKYLKEK